jgi:NADPH:quinone reductase-like Zn-dependent oxidoreductase
MSRRELASGASGHASPSHRDKSHETGDRQDFSFDQAKQAFAHMESGAHFGKVAIAIG